MKKLIILTIFIISSVYATTFVPISLKKQITLSHSVVKGVVISKSYESHETFGVVTRVKIKADKYLGVEANRGVVDIYYPGGEIDGQKIIVSGSPQLSVGENIVVLLNNQEDKSWVSNLGLGKYSVKNIGEKQVLVNQIFPEHPELGHISLKRFYKLVERVKNSKLKERSISRYEYEAEKKKYQESNKRKDRSIASVGTSEPEERLPIIWLVFIFGISGILFQLIRNKKL